ncbi:hypothetical protein [Micromonospora sp. NPDC093277]|uniref:hypothetical protein n=1 Tax=Micromonospora sp. NPDC093277 TaxID=3364291 RepID=UPI00382CE9D9
MIGGDEAGLPNRTQIRDCLVSLINGTLSVDAVATWARRWLLDDDVDIRDDVILDVLDTLAGADIETTPGVHLHGQEDFESWLTDFDLQVDAARDIS